MNSLANDTQLERLDDLVTLVQPSAADVKLETWLQQQAAPVSDWLRDSPALLFRGFTAVTQSTLLTLSGTFAEPINYVYRSTPRTELQPGLYTATEYPCDTVIPQHCENAYQKSWPLHLFFYCETAAASGGETPLSDVRKVTAAIPADIVEEFRQRGVKYVRNYSPGLDIPWQTVFQTEDKSRVEDYCCGNAIRFEWVGTDGLRTEQVCQGTAVHPETGDELWFNQAHLFHVSNLEGALRDYLLSMYTEDELPRNAFYGDGPRIENDVLDQVRNAFDQHTFAFDWCDGDILLVDNMLCAHGRNTYSGSRKVLVSMNTPVSS